MELNVTGRSVLVEDGGESAVVTIDSLLREGADVTVSATTVCTAVEDLAGRGLLRWTTGAVARHRFDVVVSGAVLSRPEPPPRSGDGQVTLVGAGPGDPGLVTVAGRAAVEAADVVLADRLVPWEALRWARADARIIDVSKVPYGRSTGQDEINRLLVEHARAGRHVVRFKGGDPFVLGRGFEEVLACAEAGIAARVIPGVTSSVAGPAVAGVPVTHRGLVQGFTVVSGHVAPNHVDSTVDYAALARSGTTLVVLMGIRTLPGITAALLAGGLDAATPCAVVADATLPSQQVLRSTLAELAAEVQAADLGPPAVAVIGAVAALSA